MILCALSAQVFSGCGFSVHGNFPAKVPPAFNGLSANPSDSKWFSEVHEKETGSGLEFRHVQIDALKNAAPGQFPVAMQFSGSNGSSLSLPRVDLERLNSEDSTAIVLSKSEGEFTLDVNGNGIISVPVERAGNVLLWRDAKQQGRCDLAITVEGYRDWKDDFKAGRRLNRSKTIAIFWFGLGSRWDDKVATKTP